MKMKSNKIAVRIFTLNIKRGIVPVIGYRSRLFSNSSDRFRPSPEPGAIKLNFEIKI